MKRIYMSLMINNKDLAKAYKIVAQTESDRPQHDPGRVANPEPSEPSDKPQPQDKPIPMKEQKQASNTLFTVAAESRMEFTMEVEAEDANDATFRTPNLAVDLLDSIKETLHEKFRSYNISFDRIKAVQVKEVPLNKED